MRVMILGAYGQIGTALRTAFAFDEVHPFGRELDLLHPERVMNAIRAIRPRYVINAAGYTYMEGAEKDAEKAMKVNAHPVIYLTAICEEIGAALVQFSPESVFDGNNCMQGYYETNEPDPAMSANVYGRSKAEAERLLRRAKNQHYIIRTSWVYGQHGHNLVNRFVNLLQTGYPIHAPQDVFACPTSAADLADAVRLLLTMNCYPGVYHLANEGTATPFGLAKTIAGLLRLNTQVLVGTDDSLYRTAKPPKHGVLVATKMKGMRPFREALIDYLIGTGDIDLRTQLELERK
jgi:dTDP-4-dehydrorhamnose reductase